MAINLATPRRSQMKLYKQLFTSKISQLFLATILIAALFTTIGCSDNPVASDPQELPQIPTEDGDTYVLDGSITYSNVSDETTASIVLTNRGTGETLEAKEKVHYAFTDLPKGYYSLEIAESTEVYATSHYFYLDENLTLDLFRVSKSSATSPSINFFGTVNEAAHHTSIQYATVTAKNTITNNIYNATTINDGSFYFLGMASGTYEVTFNAPSYTPLTKTLSILDDKIVYQTQDISLTSTANFTDVTGNALVGYNLNNNILGPSFLPTGTLMGRLISSNGSPIPVGTPLVLLYDDDLTDQRKPTKLYDFIMQDSQGHFTASSLPSGFYAVAHKSYNLTPTKNSMGDIIGYDITAGGVMNTFLKVEIGKVTTLPKVE